MAWVKKTGDEIMKSLGPKKTGHIYEHAWNQFVEFINFPPRGTSEPPTEDDYLSYYDYLHEGRKYKASTMWNTYAKLNSCHQRRYGKAIQSMPRLKLQLKRYNQGYIRKTAAIFTQAEIKQALQIDIETPKWILRKAAISLAYCGGLRGAELRALSVGNIKVKDDGVWVEYSQAKQKGEQKTNLFVVPFYSSAGPVLPVGLPALVLDDVCFGSYVVKYLELLRRSQPDIKAESPLFWRARVSGLGKQPMGCNMLGNITKEVAQKLNLPNPERYTGHCLRRSAATEAASRGATSVNMKTHFGWVQVNDSNHK